MPKLEKYPSYKNSGVEWLGDIPEHWEVKRIKYITKLISGFPFNSQKFDEFNGVNVVRIGDIKDTVDLSKCIKSIENKIHKDAVIYKNDTLIALSGATTGKSCFIYDDIEEAFINQRIAKFNYKNSFLYYCVSNEKFKKDILLGADGSAQENISNTKIENMFIPFPDNIEQIKIASFLDEKTAQIDEVISQKEKLIELLKERKQIVINDAVTKGLDKNVEFVDSGVEWIGKIPKHWNIEKGKRLFQQMKRPVREQDEIVTCFRDGEVTLRTNRRTDGFTNALKEHGYQGIRKGDFVIHNMDAFAGAIGISDSDGKSTPVYSVCRPWDEDLVFSEYYARYLRNLALQDFILSLAKGIRERSTDFRFKDFGELEYPLPPKEEQIKIVEYIENQTSKIDIAIELEQNYISKLREYKASLIDSVVTGKVRVA